MQIWLEGFLSEEPVLGWNTRNRSCQKELLDEKWSGALHRTGWSQGKSWRWKQLSQSACVWCVKSLIAFCPPQLKSFLSPLRASGTCPVTSRPLSSPPRGRVPSLPGPCPVLGDVSRHCPASVLSSGTCPSLPGLCPVLGDVSRHCPAPVLSCPRGCVPSLPGPHFLLLGEASASLTSDCVLSKPRLLPPYNRAACCLLGLWGFSAWLPSRSLRRRNHLLDGALPQGASLHVTHRPGSYCLLALCAQPCAALCDPEDSVVARQAPPSMGFSRQGYWGGQPLASPGDLPEPGIEPESPASAGGFLTV